MAAVMTIFGGKGDEVTEGRGNRRNPELVMEGA
jgi:hypothetical protein